MDLLLHSVGMTNNRIAIRQGIGTGNDSLLNCISWLFSMEFFIWWLASLQVNVFYTLFQLLLFFLHLIMLIKGYMCGQERNQFGSTGHLRHLNSAWWKNCCNCWLGPQVFNRPLCLLIQYSMKKKLKFKFTLGFILCNDIWEEEKM